MKEYESHTNPLLLHLLAQSDEIAFTEIYNRYWKKLYVIAFNRLKESQEAEDIVHDVFASLWANRQHTTIESLDNYLATAAKYLVLTKFKRKERERTYAGNNSSDAKIFDLPIENALHYKCILEIVQREVETLPEKCRLIYKYSRDEGMPVKQIASTLSLSPKTVENQLNKALRHLKLVTRSVHSALLMLF